MPSIFWSFFHKNEISKTATCKKCLKVINVCGNTTNLKQHLQRHHPALYLKINKDVGGESITDENAAAVSCSPILSDSQNLGADNIQFQERPEVEENHYASNVSTSLSSSQISVPRNKKQATLECFHQQPLTKLQQESITDSLVYMIAVDLLPYRTVEKEGFIKFMKKVCPLYKISNRKAISEVKIPKLFLKIQENISIALQRALYISLTTDCWTSSANESYIGVTAHFIDDNWDLKSVCLACKFINEDETAANITNVIRVVLGEWHIDNSKITACTTDCGSNVISAMKLLKFVNVNCFGHTLNNAISKILKLEDVKETLEKIKKIHNCFSHSSKMQRELVKQQTVLGRQEKHFPSYTPTRWWSILGLMKVCVEEQLTLIALFQKDHQRKHLILSQFDIDSLQTLINFIEPFASMSEHLSSEHNVTASAIIPLLKTIVDNNLVNNGQDDDDDGTDETSDLLADHLQHKISSIAADVLKKRYSNKNDSRICEQLNLLGKTTFLDPRFKDDPDAKKAEQEVKDELLTIFSKDGAILNRPEEGQKGLAFLLKRVRENQPITKEQLFEKEFNTYTTTPAVGIEINPLAWWKSNSVTFPNLAKLAKKYLCVQGTSVPSERVFSRGGLVVEDSRTLLTGEHVEQLVMISMNKCFM